MADTYSFDEYCAAVEGEPFIAIYNDGPNGDTIELTELHLDYPTSTRHNAGALPKETQIRLVSAYSGGTSIPLAPARSDSPNLSGAVSVIAIPDSITSTTLLRNAVILDYNTTSIQNPFWSFAKFGTGGACAFNINSEDVGAWLFSGKSVVQDITLAPGQGIAISATNNTQVDIMKRFTLSVAVDVDGNSYSSVFDIPSRYGIGSCGAVVFNEVGSGKTVKIKNIVSSIVPADDIPTGRTTAFGTRMLSSFAVVKYKIHNPPSGRGEITFKAMRSGSPSLSSKVLTVKGSVVGNWMMEVPTNAPVRISQGVEDFAYVSSAAHRAWLSTAFRVLRPRLFGQSITGGSFPFRGRHQNLLGKSANAIRLAKGEGLALLCTGNCPTDLHFMGSIRYISANETAAYPAVGDVDQGVQYGPTGTDYTGTLVQPAVGDVKTGVQYGAGGTEFTGTYVGGGGGNTYSRGRVVNS